MDYQQLFENLAFPTAICAVLFVVLYRIIKSELKQNENALSTVENANKEFIKYLQSQNERMTNIIADCTTALKDNSKAYQDLIKTLEYVQGKKLN